MSTLVLPSGTLYSLEDFEEDYEFGIDKKDMSIKFVETSTGAITLKNGEMENPFFVGVFGGSLQNMEIADVYKNYKKIYVMCMKNNFVMSENLFQITDQIVKINDFYQIGSQFSLIPVSLSFLTNSAYKLRGCIVDKSHLNKMFGKSYTFDTTEIIIPLVEQTEDTVRMSVSLYDSSYSIKNVGDMLSLTSHYNKNYKKPVMRQFSSHLSSLQETQFWCDPRNCDINMTEDFLARGFNYKDSSDEEHLVAINIPVQSDKKITDVERAIKILSEGNKKDTDYLNFIHGSNEFTDVSSALRNSTKRTYYISLDNNKLDLNEDDVTKMLCQIDNVEELYHTFNSFLVSKEYCHMVLNNQYVLEKVKPLFDKFGPVYKYLLGYSWLCFVTEESIMKTKSTKKNRYVFDINTANKLPLFPFVMDDLSQNPYIVLLVNNKAISPATNAMSLYCVENFNDYYGVCNFEQFKWRFNLFTTGDPSKNIFTGLDWKHYAVSGSVIPACLQKKSPLFDLVALPNQREEDKWLTFFNNYYGESDIDIMCNDMSIFGFTTKVADVIEVIKKNITEYKEGDIEIEPNKSMLMLVSDYFFTEKLNDYNEHFNDNYDPAEMRKQLNTEEMREFLFAFYFDYKSKINRVIRKEKKDGNFYIKSFMEKVQQNDMKLKHITKNITKQQDKIQDSDTGFYINDFRSADNKVPENENYLVMKICENIKFKIKSKKIKTIEIFRSKSQDFFGTVARFHFPCVRAYYQGDNVHILPSCVTAMMTGINIDYKYFAGVRNPIEIANKYRMRGFSLIFNASELKDMAYYNNNVKTHGGMFYVASTDKAEIAKTFGPREISDKIYKPLVYEQGASEDMYQKPNFTYFKTTADIKRYYKTRYGYDENTFGFSLFTIKTILDNGSVFPYKNWVSREYLNNVTLDGNGRLPSYDKFLHPQKMAQTGDAKLNETPKPSTDVPNAVQSKVKTIEQQISTQEVNKLPKKVYSEDESEVEEVKPKKINKRSLKKTEKYKRIVVMSDSEDD